MSAQKLGHNLERIKKGDTVQIACQTCGEEICESGENYKKHVLCDTMPIEEAGPLMNDPFNTLKAILSTT